MPSDAPPVWILGGSGYVAGETVRLLSRHPGLKLAGVVSGSQVGEPIVSLFPHLGSTCEHLTFSSLAQAKGQIDHQERIGIISAMPHGESEGALCDLLSGHTGRSHIVDLSADFRFGQTLNDEPFLCALPDDTTEESTQHVAHPGCFTTAFTLAAAPLWRAGLIEGRIVAVGVTGSTGSGRTPKPGTHHPERHSGHRAYEPLTHRHAREMNQLLGDGASVVFVPHSGAFSRGIHMTVSAQTRKSSTRDELHAVFESAYAHTPFVRIQNTLPSIKEVVGSNRCHIGLAVNGNEVVVVSVIDNLIKGAAGGGVQWLNRLMGLPMETGLDLDGLGWN